MTTYLITESGDRLVTESGDYLILDRQTVTPINIVLAGALVGEPLVLSVTAWSSNLSEVSAVNATSYPEFHVRGPGNLFAIENHTTKQGLYFTNLEIARDEYLIIRISPVNGLILTGVPRATNYLSPVSDTELSMTPGANNISVVFEIGFEQISGDSGLDNFLVNGLNAENTNNGSSFTIKQIDPGGGGDQVLTFHDYNDDVLARGYVAVGSSHMCYLKEVDSSGVSGTIATSGTWSAETLEAEFVVGLASVVWKNRRWSIDEAIDG